MTVKPATAFDRLETLAAILREQSFSIQRVEGGWNATVGMHHIFEAETLDDAVDLLASNVLDHQWRQLHEARNVANLSDQRIKTLTRLGF